MAHILTRKYGPGNTRYTAVIRIRKGKSIVHREAKTFAHRTAALTWAKHREVLLEDPNELKRAQEGAATQGADKYHLKKIIRWYITNFKSIANWGRTKQTTLEYLERHAIGDEDCRELTTAKLTQHIQQRRNEGAGPATVANDLVWIGVVLRAAKSAEGLRVHPENVREAQIACRELRLIGKSKRRDRRPTADENQRLREYFTRAKPRSAIPMADILDFAYASSKRLAEICRLLWSDNDPRGRTGLVRDAKHPTEKDGNHRRFKYTPEAWAIVERQPRTSERIFPYNPKTVGGYFTKACRVLGIVDLRFHDSRHEATSQLFERGYQIQEVALVTSHESWETLKRYTHLKPENLREIKPATPNVAHRLRRSPARTSLREPSRAADRSTRPDRPRSPARVTSARPA